MRKGRVRGSYVVVWLCTERHYDAGYSSTVPYSAVAGRRVAWTASTIRSYRSVLQKCDVCFGLLGSGISHMLPTLGFFGG